MRSLICEEEKIDLQDRPIDESMRSLIVQQLEFLGEDPTREGLLGTPERVLRSWEELYKGYSQNPKDIFTTFESDGYNEIVLLKEIELFSICEHHLLPFFGIAHIAYIPDGRIIGVSKLARLLDIFARRLQIQERIGEQVVESLMFNLRPLGAACIIQATHLCMRMRGCSKQRSTMVTSSLRGVFMSKPEARAELMMLIGK